PRAGPIRLKADPTRASSVRLAFRRETLMRVVLADLKGANGFVSKDTVAGGYGSRLRPFSKTAAMVCMIKRRLHSPPSVQMAYRAALAAAKGHETSWTSERLVDGDVALVLSSLVDHKHETAWAD